MTDKELFKLALDALETEVSIDWTNNDEFNASAEKMHEAIAALKERLAQPEQTEVQQLIALVRAQQITIDKLEAALAQPEQDNTYGYASRLAIAIWQKHYRNDAPKWKPLETTEGVLTQIDNMTCGLVKEKPPQRTWVGLTEEDRAKILSRKWWDFEDEFDVDGFLRLAEAKLKKKNT